MGLLLPIALALLALAIPVVLFYMLRLRRTEHGVSSALLWQRALLDRTANAPWQRLRRNLLLLLQLLLLLLLVLALARPFVSANAPIGGSVVVVLDASASMQATDEDGGITRFERARREARAILDGLGTGQLMTIVWAGPIPYVAASAQSDKAALHSILGSLAPSNGRADMPAALTLAASSARQLGDPSLATTVLISDGTFASEANLPQLPGQVRYIGVGRSDRNVGITALSLREATDGPELFASLFNSGKTPTSALLAIKVDGALRDSRQVGLGSGEEKGITVSGLPLGTRLVEADLTSSDPAANLLPADDRAWVVRTAPASSDVLLVSAGNSFMEKALQLVPNVTLSRTTPPQYSPPARPGLTVLDGFIPAQLPPGNLLLIDPPGSSLLPVSGTVQYPVVGQVEANDPLMRFVDLSGMHLASAERINPPSWARVLARSTAGDPLILAGERGGRRVAVLAFDLHQSDLPLQVAFPILVANLVQWLQPGAQATGQPALSAGDPISLALEPEADQVSVAAPGGKTTALPVSGQTFPFAGTDQLGVYSLQQMSKGKPLGEAQDFAVNLFSREESDITPRSGISLDGSQPAQPGAAPTREVEVWPWVLLAALLLLGVEWWLYNRAGRWRLAPPSRVSRLLHRTR